MLQARRVLRAAAASLEHSRVRQPRRAARSAQHENGLAGSPCRRLLLTNFLLITLVARLMRLALRRLAHPARAALAPAAAAAPEQRGQRRAQQRSRRRRHAAGSMAQLAASLGAASAARRVSPAGAPLTVVRYGRAHTLTLRDAPCGPACEPPRGALCQSRPIGAGRAYAALPAWGALVLAACRLQRARAPAGGS